MIFFSFFVYRNEAVHLSPAVWLLSLWFSIASCCWPCRSTFLSHLFISEIILRTYVYETRDSLTRDEDERIVSGLMPVDVVW